LNLQNNNFEDTIPGNITELTALKTLLLAGNRFGTDSASPVADIFFSLEKLSIGRNSADFLKNVIETIYLDERFHGVKQVQGTTLPNYYFLPITHFDVLQDSGQSITYFFEGDVSFAQQWDDQNPFARIIGDRIVELNTFIQSLGNLPIEGISSDFK
jgi:hypothetical protein